MAQGCAADAGSTVGGKMAFACVDGPEFRRPASVDLDELLARAKRFDPSNANPCGVSANNTSATYPSSPFSLEISQARYGSSTQTKKTIKTIAKNKTAMPEQDPAARARNWSEVTLGYSEEQAVAEAARCIQCKKPGCIAGARWPSTFRDSSRPSKTATSARPTTSWRPTTCCPAICGRVCRRKRNVKRVYRGQKLDRWHRPARGFVGDMALKNGWSLATSVKPNGHKAP